MRQELAIHGRAALARPSVLRGVRATGSLTGPLAEITVEQAYLNGGNRPSNQLRPVRAQIAVTSLCTVPTKRSRQSSTSPVRSAGSCSPESAAWPKRAKTWRCSASLSTGSSRFPSPSSMILAKESRPSL